MTSFFGPERPLPLCVASEWEMRKSIDSLMRQSEDRAIRRRNTVRYNEIEHRASANYERDLCTIISKYLEIDCNDDILFMRCLGDEMPIDELDRTDTVSKASFLNDPYTYNWPDIIEKKFCLLKSVDQCIISQRASYSPVVKQKNKAQLSVNTGISSEDILAQEPSFEAKFIVDKSSAANAAINDDGDDADDDNDEFEFRSLDELMEDARASTSTKKRVVDKPNKKYDKIIIKNCLKFFEEDPKYFCEYIMTLFKHQIQYKTSLLIIQRVHDLNTLPFYNQINQEWSINDAKYTKFMQEMQNEYFSIKFDIELLKCLIDCKDRKSVV